MPYLSFLVSLKNRVDEDDDLSSSFFASNPAIAWFTFEGDAMSGIQRQLAEGTFPSNWRWSARNWIRSPPYPPSGSFSCGFDSRQSLSDNRISLLHQWIDRNDSRRHWDYPGRLCIATELFLAILGARDKRARLFVLPHRIAPSDPLIECVHATRIGTIGP